MRKLVVFLALAAVSVAAVMARAEEKPEAKDPKATALDLIDKGRAALVADKTQEAVELLQKAVGLIQKSLEKGFVAYLPSAPEGWTRDEPDTNSGSWGSGEQTFQWTSASATYRRESDGLEVDVSITSSPQMIQPQRAALDMYKNPQVRKMMEMDQETKFEFFEEGDWAGWITTDKSGSSDLIAIGKNEMVTVSVPKPLPDVARKFWGAVDKKGLAGKQ